jgi:hypothetical protein
MQRRHQIAASLIFLLIAATLFGIWHTRQARSLSASPPAKNSKQANSSLTAVDQTPLKVAQQLAQLAATPEERAAIRSEIAQKLNQAQS